MIAKCSRCQHEWQAVGKPGVCDWCGGDGVKLADDYIESVEAITARRDRCEDCARLKRALREIRDEAEQGQGDVSLRFIAQSAALALADYHPDATRHTKFQGRNEVKL